MREYRLYPTDLTDAQWRILEPLLPKAKKRGRRPTDRRRILNGLLYFVRAGCPWRLLPKEYGPWEMVYGYFRRWRQQGLWGLIHEILRTFVRHQAGKRSHLQQRIAGYGFPRRCSQQAHSPNPLPLPLRQR